MPHLWEVEHSYYCNIGNFFRNDCHARYSSWESFYAQEGDDDLDLNLLVRWDWVAPEPEEEPTDHELLLFFISQRKSFNRSVSIRVVPADEDNVRAYLMPRLRHLIQLWLPLTEGMEP